MIEVCMATFNGASYIVDQLESIFAQSVAVDRITIIDDASTDTTVELIENFRSDKINLIKNEVNVGYTKTFEKALSQSTFEYIFLCDQDDIWLQNKVEECLRLFEINGKANLVVHRLRYVNQNLEPFEKIRQPLKGFYSKFQLVREFLSPRFFGCAMVLKRELLELVLPFPDSVYTHDHWISTASMISGSFLATDKELILYRRHFNALTSHNRDPFFETLKNRVFFLKNIKESIVRAYY